MSDRLEIAGLIVQEIIKAKAAVIVSNVNANTQGKMSLVNEHLSDEAIATTYKKIFAAVNNPSDD